MTYKGTRSNLFVQYYVYILELSDDSYYTGYTNNIERRLTEHRNKRGSKYVRSRLPLNLVFYETYNDRSVAMRRELAIKKFSRKNKEKLVYSFDLDIKQHFPSL